MFLSQVTSACHYLHSKHIVHGALQAEYVNVVSPDLVSWPLLRQSLMKQNDYKIFETISGLKINCSKTEGMWISSLSNHKAKPFDIKWPYEPIKSFGEYFTDNQKLLKEENFIQ